MFSRGRCTNISVSEISETPSCIPQQMFQYSRPTTVDSYTLRNMVGCHDRWRVFYYAKYFEQIKAPILEFNQNEAATLRKVRQNFNTSIETDLKTIFIYLL
ncbi:hypothetical protein NQ318_023398 [Aromia moschata]|uniref:Uncharacterized protein n=1 Tax=Aromia moschata TaxID=1265417 RepID=A0AAV8YVX3_9CUCU|nr:hypothetical protein NQ318_023398 [Aromia moschata]